MEYKKKELDKDSEFLRLAIIALLVAVMFGILQIYPEGKTFDHLELGVVMKVISLSILYGSLPLFSLYLLFLGLNSRYEKKWHFIKFQELLYDIGIYTTTFIFVMTILFSLLIWISMTFPKIPISIIVGLIYFSISISAVIIILALRNYFKSIKWKKR